VEKAAGTAEATTGETTAATASRRLGHDDQNSGLPADEATHPSHVGGAAPQRKEMEQLVKPTAGAAGAPAKTARQPEEKVNFADHGDAATADTKKTAEEPTVVAHDQQRHPYSNQNLQENKRTKSE
jgi:hypothetical protein